MELKLIDGSATAIGDATGVAVARLRRSQAQSKAVMLLTDGDNNAGQISPEYAAHLAKLVGANPKGTGYLDEAAYEGTVATLMGGGSDPVITVKPEGAWTHAVIEKAMGM